MQFETTEQKNAYIKNVKEIADSMARAQGETEFQQEVVNQGKDKYGKDNAAQMKNIAKIYFKDNLDEEEAKRMEPIEGYKELFES